MKILRSVLGSLRRSPVKSLLTLLTVGLGVGVLIFALGISSSFSRLMKAELENGGIVVTVSNAKVSESTGQIEQVRPSEFDTNVLSILSSEVDGVTAVSPVGNTPWNELLAAGKTYQIRSAVSTDAGYADVMGLTIIAGSFYTASDVSSGARKAVISESLATILFGSADAAVGQVLRSPSSTSATSTQATGPRGPVMPALTVSGVFRDVGELQRTSYGVGDLLVPYTAVMQGNNAQMMIRSSMSTVVMKVTGSSLATVEAQVREVLGREYGEDASIAVWEGTPRGDTSTLAEARSTVATFSVVVNLLGFMLLATGSIGILSIMIVEVLGKSREIAIERALGASRGTIAQEYFVRSLLLSGMAALVGVLFALTLAGPLEQLVLPIFSGVTAADLAGGVITPASIAVGVGAALLVGGVMGIFPVIPALKTNLVEGMREAA